MNNKDKSMQLLKALVEQNDNDLKEMKSFMLSLNYDSCKKLAHKMKSGANMLGIKEMISILCDIEESENELDIKIALLEKIINDVKEEIESRY
ncbi:hypothetical protein HJ067_21465 [Vibrio parahaemolyticus]|nr:hypothetical protein [Vibrio parahaemolyticus]